MTEHFLDDAQIRSITEQMGRERVTEKMRIYIGIDPRGPCALLHHLPDPDRRQFGAARRKKNLVPGSTSDELRPLPLEIDAQRRAGFRSDRNQAHFIA